MLHHYNYTHFLTYHQLPPETPGDGYEDSQHSSQNSPGGEEGRRGSKSFTIAAILGLQGDKEAINLSQRRGEEYARGYGECSSRQGVKSLKHLSSSLMQHKKSCKSKRVRTIFTPEQLERLEAEFERQQYMVGPERLYLAHTLQLTEAQVKVWFQNRRIKWRKHHLELTHQRLAVLKQQQLLIDDTQPDVQDTNSSSTDT